MIARIRRMARRSQSGPMLLALALALVAGGCYTLIRHPHTEDPVASGSDDLCYSCHASDEGLDLDLYPWAGYYSHSTSPWINYYASPWWYDARWERLGPAPTNSDDSADGHPAGGRSAWGRRTRTTSALDSLRIRETLTPPAPIISPPSPVLVPPGTPAQNPSPPDSSPSDAKKKKKEAKEPRDRSLRR